MSGDLTERLPAEPEDQERTEEPKRRRVAVQPPQTDIEFMQRFIDEIHRGWR